MDVEAGFVDVERRRQLEDRLVLLERHDAAGGEGPAVADAIDHEVHGDADLARAQEVRVQGVDVQLGPDRVARRPKRLARNLPAEQAPPWAST